jgi:hypothetical protein
MMIMTGGHGRLQWLSTHQAEVQQCRRTYYVVECDGCQAWAGILSDSMTGALIQAFEANWRCGDHAARTGDRRHYCLGCTPSVAALVERRKQELGVG